MAEAKQPAGEAMDVDSLRVGTVEHSKRLANAELSSLRRTISAPSVKRGDINDQASVFTNRRSSLDNNITTENNISSNSNHNNNSSSSSAGSISPIIRSRTRTYSAGSHFTPMVLNVDCSSTSPSPIPVGSPAPRVIQIKREESVDELTREIAKERDITSTIQLSRSWDETSWLGDKNYMVTGDSNEKQQDGIDELMLPAFNPSISSPVRFIDRHHHNRSLTPSPIGVPISPKQKMFRRSLSPSSLRPSLLTSKRKLDPDDPDACNGSPAKRNSIFYSPFGGGGSVISCTSSGSSPDHHSDTNSNLFSCDEDSGNEQVFLPNPITPKLNPNHCQNNTLSCDTRSHSFPFVKPRYVAPQSPLATGMHSASIAHENNRKNSLVSASYTFTPVKE